jgi:hypothetical protein
VTRVFTVRSTCGRFEYGRPVLRIEDRSAAIGEARRRVRRGERAWVEDGRGRVVWGRAIRPTRRRECGMEWWKMCHLDTRA